MDKEQSRKLQQAIDAVNDYGTITKAAKKLGIPRKTLSSRYNKAIDQGYCAGVPVIDTGKKIVFDAKLKSITKEKRELQQKYDSLLKTLEETAGTKNIISDMQQQIALADPERVRITMDRPGSSRSESVAVMLCSDLHYEERIIPATVNGLNEYDTSIAETRFFNVFKNGLKLVEMTRHSSDIKTLILWLGGDLISGYIHEELKETNAMSPVEASLSVYRLCESAIDFLAENGGFEQIVVVCSVGNHGRTTDKTRFSTCVENSFEWLIYNFLASKYADSKIVRFNLSRSYLNYMNIYKWVVRFHHGNYVRYGGGVGGITIPLNKAIAHWNQSKHADLDVFGHWHQRMSGKNYVCNGSIIGYGPYALAIKAPFEVPQQSFFLINSGKGKTVEAPIFVE